MSEIQFLCDLILNNKCPKGIKDKIIARIGEVEAQLGQRPQSRPIQTPTISQISATQMALDAQNAQDNRIAAISTPSPSVKIDKQTGTVVVPTGRGTSGMRKW